MARVEKGNVVLDILDNEIETYLNKGYDVVDESGKVVRACVPRNVQTLQLAYINNTKEIAELKERIAQLEEEVKSKTKKAKTADKE